MGHTIITGDTLWRALVAAGVFREEEGDERVRRFVIDAETGHPVIIYVERWGDERLLHVAPTLNGVEIRGVPADDTQTSGH
jgi:hypothetical protein